MIKLLFPISLLFFASSFGQTATIVASKIAVLKDAATNCIDILDSAHTSVTAYNSAGVKLWTGFTYDCNYTPDDNTTRQKILTMKFDDGSTVADSCKECGGSKIIRITYCYCAGFICLKTGHIYGGDCD
jgi:hypothetical protein